MNIIPIVSSTLRVSQKKFIRHLGWLGLIPLLVSAASAATILNDFDANNLTNWNGTGGSTSSIGESWAITGNNQFKVVSGTTTPPNNFQQFAKTDFLATNSDFLTAVSLGTQIQFDYRTFTADNASAGDFQIRLVANTNANGFGYQGVGQVFISNPAGANSSGTLLVDFSGNTGFINALNDYRAGSSGTFFEFVLDNAGFPGIPSPVTFSIDNVTAIPEPSTYALLALGGGILIARMRYRKAVNQS